MKLRKAEGPIQSREPVSDFAEAGASGLYYIGGYVRDDFLPELVGVRGMRVFREIRDNEPIVGAILKIVDMLSRRVPWTVTPSGDEDVDKEAAEFVETCMQDLNVAWGEFISEALTMLPFGWAFHELTYKRRLGSFGQSRSRNNDGRVGWKKIALRGQETLNRWIFDDKGGVIAMEQLAPPNYRLVQIPLKKALLFRTTVHMNNPEGRSVLRNAYVPYFNKKKIQTIEGIGIDRDLAGMPFMQVPPEILDRKSQDPKVSSMRQSLETLGKRIRRDEQDFIMFPSNPEKSERAGYKFELLSSGGSRQFDTNQIITRYQTEIALSLLGDFLLFGHRETGSYSLGSSRTHLFSTAIGTYLDIIQDVINQHALPRLFDLNPDLKGEKLPAVAHGDIETPDLTELSNYIATLTGAGVPVFPNDKLEQYLMRIAALPMKQEGLTR